ncbi:site-specific integrase [Bacteroidales bacterium OttesenSCG-928-J19]|nr:site-specific integrase [Bacteroidales bacterium OttesenSCG-928-J19]
MTSVHVVFRPSTRPGHFEGSLSLRLIQERNVKAITLPGCKLYPEEWNKAAGHIIYPAEDLDRSEYLSETNNRINHEVKIIKNHLMKMEQRGRYSLDDVAKLYRRYSDDDKLLGYGETLALEKERRGSHRTAGAYRSSMRALVRYNKGDIPLNHINSLLIKDFEKHLEREGKMKNTISYYMRNLRVIYNRAVSDNRILNKTRENPFSGVFTGVAKTIKRSLKAGEVKSIEDVDFPGKISEAASIRKKEALMKIQKAQRYFLFCVYARGMCFIDLAYLKKSDIRDGTLQYIRKKTGSQIGMKVTPEMQSIMDSFADEVRDSSYVFPIIDVNNSNPEKQYEYALRIQNMRLKALANMSGIQKPVSTHWARHSWATIAKQENIPVNVISEGLGHSSERVTQIYLGLLNNSLLDEANERIISALRQPTRKKRK